MAPFFGFLGLLSLCHIRQKHHTRNTHQTAGKHPADPTETYILGRWLNDHTGGRPYSPKRPHPGRAETATRGGWVPLGGPRSGRTRPRGRFTPARPRGTDRAAPQRRRRAERVRPAEPDARKGTRASHTGRTGNMPRRRAPGREEEPRGRMARKARERGQKRGTRRPPAREDGPDSRRRRRGTGPARMGWEGTSVER